MVFSPIPDTGVKKKGAPDPGPQVPQNWCNSGNNTEFSLRPAVFLWVNIVDCDDGVLDSGLVVVCVRLGPHAEGVGLEAGHAEHCVIPKIKDIWCYCTSSKKVHMVCRQQSARRFNYFSGNRFRATGVNFCIFFWRARMCRPLLRLCRPFMIF